MRTRLGRRCRGACLVVATGLIPFDADSLGARGVLDVNDPAFAGRVVVTLPVAVVPAGATSFQFTSNGVTFLFESLDGVSSLSATNGVPVVPRFQTGFRGVRLTITPPVAAIGFFRTEFDSLPQGTFVGTLATEDVRAPLCQDLSSHGSSARLISAARLSESNPSVRQQCRRHHSVVRAEW